MARTLTPNDAHITSRNNIRKHKEYRNGKNINTKGRTCIDERNYG